MNNKKKAIISIITIIVLIIAFILLKMFILGSKSYENIEITNVSKSRNNTILIEGNINNSKEKYKDFSYILVGKELYITTKTVKTINALDNNKISIEIPLKLDDIDHIHLTDDKTTKVIYNKK